MKKFFLVWAVLVLAAPVMAADPNVIDVCAVPIGGDLVEIRYRVVSGQLPRAFALDITVSDGNIIAVTDFFRGGECDDVNKGYGIFPASFKREIDADDPDWSDVNYTPVADVCDLPGTQGGEGTPGVTIEMGSLYVDDNSPPTEGLLCVIQVSTDCSITLATNVGRGKVVLEDGTAIDPCLFHGPPITLPWDFGDAIDGPYPTLLASGGARHRIGPLFMGKGIDPEPDGQPNLDATGDDLNILYAGIAHPPGDEDGVVFSAITTPLGGSVTVEVSQSCKLNAWIDFNNDGVWAMGLPEQIAINVVLPLVSPLVNVLPFAVPPGAVLETHLISRWRVSHPGGLTPEGPEIDGEVEDYNEPNIVCHVPDEVNEPNLAAQAELIANGFTIGAVTAEFDDNIPDGNVISTDPAYCNIIPCANAVDVVVSKGPCIVPNVVDMIEADACDAIEANGFGADSTNSFDDNIVDGNVISQSLAGQQLCGTTVTIDVSDGPCIVPPVVGMPQAVAEGMITGSGFPSPTIDTAYHDSMPEGNVISQSEAAFTTPGCSTVIILVVSDGPCVVPNVVGMSYADACDAIDANGFVLGTVTPVDGNGATLGQVMAQSPAASGTPGCGTAVDINVAGDCMAGASTHPDYAEWVSVGKPDCWCYPRQCRGDTNDAQEYGIYWVLMNDLADFQTYFSAGGISGEPGICSDFAHDIEYGVYRVLMNDLAIFQTYFSTGGVPCCDQDGDCDETNDDYFNFWKHP